MENENETSNISDFPYMDIEIVTLSKVSSIIILLILAILFIFGIILNLISIIAILRTKKLEIISILILNLAFADIVYLTGIPFFTMSALFGSWPFGLSGCIIFYLIDYVGMVVGVYTVAALSLERFLVVTDNKKRLENLSDKFKKFIVFIYLTIIWLIGIIFSLPLLLNIYLGKSMDDTYTCELNIDETKQDIILILRFFLIFILPFSIILTSSVKLIFFLKKNSFSTRRKSNSNEKESNSKANSVHQKAIKIVLSIVFMFIIQWLPLWTGILKFVTFYCFFSIRIFFRCHH
jgi:uncharacterized membrane protein (Fun14 family)